MSDLEQLIRDDLARRIGQPQPEAAAMLHRVRRARRRGRAVTITACALAVLLLSAGMVAWLQRTPTSALPPGTVKPTMTGDAPADAKLRSLANARFYTAADGFALLEKCQAEVCRLWLASTSDGGATWHSRAVPDEWRAAPWLRVLGPDRVALDWPDADDRLARLFTTDRGRTWTRPSTTPRAVLTEVPPGALADLGGPAFRPEVRKGMADILLQDGTTATLARFPLPTGSKSWTGLRETRNGVLFFSHDDKLLISGDRGRSWTTIPLPEEGFPVVTVDGEHLYAVTDEPVRVRRYDHRTRTWQALPFPVTPPPHFGLMLPRADGGMIVGRPAGDDAFAFVVGPDDMAFQAHDPATAGWTSYPGPRYITGYDNSMRHTTDLLTWTEFPFPTGTY